MTILEKTSYVIDALSNDQLPGYQKASCQKDYQNLNPQRCSGASFQRVVRLSAVRQQAAAFEVVASVYRYRHICLAHTSNVSRYFPEIRTKRRMLGI